MMIHKFDPNDESTHPEPGRRVLVWCGDKGGPEINYSWDLGFIRDGVWSFSPSGSPPERVTHWMEIPEVEQ